MSSNPLLAAVSRISKEEKLKNLSNSPVLVLLVYGLVLVPLALYVFHDIIDHRWRPIYLVIRYNIAYLLLYIVAATFLVGYAVIQWLGSDFKEVGAASVALILATYRVWTLIRLTAIIAAHRRLVMVLKTCNERLDELSLNPKQFQLIKYFLFRKPPRDIYDRHLYISASLFDDGYPGHSVRIRWLSMYSTVHKNDVNECASRIAVWMRVVLGNKNMRIWDELTDSKLGAFDTGYSGKLYETLLKEFRSKPADALPAHISDNPGEELINLKGSVERSHLRKLGAGIFWCAARVRDEEFSQSIAAFPAHWMHQTEHTGKKMMFDMGSILMLSGMEIPDGPTGNLLQLTTVDLQNPLPEEDSKKIWEMIIGVCVQAMAVMILRDHDDAKRTGDCEVLRKISRITEVVETGMSMMRDSFRNAGGTIEMLCLHLICMIRRAYFGAYIVESVWGAHMDHIDVGKGCYRSSRLFLAEVSFSLYHVLVTLDCCERNPFREDHFKEEKKEISLLSCDGHHVHGGGQKCPASAFRVFVKTAERAATTVYGSFYDAVNVIQETRGQSDSFA